MGTKAHTVLIPGGTGLLGVPLVNFLREHGYHVVSLGRKQGNLVCDLLDREALHARLNDVAPQTIVNLAALTDVDRCERHRQEAYEQNVRAVENLVAWTKTRPGTHFIQISTDQVYDGPGDKREAHLTMLNVYALTKYCGEVLATSVGGTALRTNFFGKSQVTGRRSLSDSFYEGLSQAKPMKLFRDIYFSPLSISTLCRSIEKTIAAPHPGVYNLGSHGGFSKADFALAMAKVFDFPTGHAEIVESTVAQLFAPRPKDMRMDVTFFERTFSVQLPTLAEEIASLRRDYV